LVPVSATEMTEAAARIGLVWRAAIMASAAGSWELGAGVKFVMLSAAKEPEFGSQPSAPNSRLVAHTGARVQIGPMLRELLSHR
jgi:hypothetical protein